MKLEIGEYYVDENGDVFQLTKDYRGLLQSAYITCKVTPFSNVVRKASKKEIEKYLEEKS